jgi:hypothetical protein
MPGKGSKDTKGKNGSQAPTPAPLPGWALFPVSAVSACWAEFTTLPIDTAKVRLQVQSGAAGGKYKGFIDCLRVVSKEEGLGALWKGLGYVCGNFRTNKYKRISYG